MDRLQTIALFIILLGVLITVHELGHFLIAKWLNVKVLRFSIGFGPKIIGFTRGETEYRVAWIPLGGYVKMAGEIPSDDVSPEDAARGFLAQPPWKRALIVVGGPLFNLIFPIIVYFFVFFGNQQAVATEIRHVDPELPAAMAGLQPGDRVRAVDGEPVVTWTQLDEKLSARANRETRLTVERDGKTFDARLTPARAFVAELFASTEGRVGISPRSPAAVLGVPPGTPAAEAGLRTFDRVLSINGEQVPDLLALREVLRAAEGTLDVTVLRLDSADLPGIRASVPRTVTVRVERLPGDGVEAIGGAESGGVYLDYVFRGGPAWEAGLRRGDRLVSIDGEKLGSFEAFRVAIEKAGTKPFTLEWRSGGEAKSAQLARGKFEHVDELGQTSRREGVGVIGAIQGGTAPEMVTVYVGPGEALGRAAAIVPKMVGMVVAVVGKLVTGDVPFNSVGGPVMLYQLAAKTSEQGVEAFLNLMAIISINLGVMNLLPIPVLDGFALLSAIWEGIRRRPIPMRVREIANMVGLAMLVILMALVMKNDLMR